ncbi:hypothetical protein A3758_37785 [Oleiphilus sp. HI0118]|nr:hypothetical protein A3758_14430 [Oleiphilus sp. HI0118]KZZ45650.1 hypothetical protein A3758_37785 [Oleiphilus sp. HI0118]
MLTYGCGLIEDHQNIFANFTVVDTIAKGVEFHYKNAQPYHHKIVPVEIKKKGSWVRTPVLPESCLRFLLTETGRVVIHSSQESKLKVSELDFEEGYCFEGDFWLVLKDKNHDPRENSPLSLCVPFVDGVILNNPSLFRMVGLRGVSQSLAGEDTSLTFMGVQWLSLFQRTSQPLWNQKEKLRIKLKEQKRAELNPEQLPGEHNE